MSAGDYMYQAPHPDPGLRHFAHLKVLEGASPANFMTGDA